MKEELAREATDRKAEGKYFAQEAKAWEALLNSVTGMRMAVDMLGLLASVAMFVAGARMKD